MTMTTTEAKDHYNTVYERWREYTGLLVAASTLMVGALVREAYPQAAAVVTEGYPRDEPGLDGLSLLSVLDADGRVLGDQNEPTDQWDAMIEEVQEFLTMLIELEPEYFDEQTWSLS